MTRCWIAGVLAAAQRWRRLLILLVAGLGACSPTLPVRGQIQGSGEASSGTATGCADGAGTWTVPYSGDGLYSLGLMVEGYRTNPPTSAGDWLTLGTFQGFLDGTVDAAVSLHATCPASRVIVTHVGDLVMSFMRQHPESRHLNAADIVIKALAETWPCRPAAGSGEEMKP